MNLKTNFINFYIFDKVPVLHEYDNHVIDSSQRSKGRFRSRKGGRRQTQIVGNKSLSVKKKVSL